MDIIAPMVKANLFFVLDRYAHRDLWIDGEPVWSPLLALREYLNKKNSCRIEIEIPNGVHLERPELISIGEGTILEPGVYIQGPCIIGKNCIIRHGAYIRESVICGDHCTIGHCAEIKHSILLDSANATHFVYVGDSILGNGVNLGAGVKCANLRLDRREVSVAFDGNRIKTGLKKFGAIVGDGSQIGCNCVLNPGTLMAKNTIARPLQNLSGYVAPSKPMGKNILEKLAAKGVET